MMCKGGVSYSLGIQTLAYSYGGGSATLDLGLSILQNYEKMNFYLSHSVFGILLRQPKQTNIPK